MAFKNEDLAIHLSEQFEQSTWEVYAAEIAAVSEWRNKRNSEYMTEYLARPNVKQAKKAYMAEYRRLPEKKAMKSETERKHREAHPEEYAAKRKRQYEQNRERILAQKAAWRERNRETVLQHDRERAAKKRAERLAAAQQLSVNQP